MRCRVAGGFAYDRAMVSETATEAPATPRGALSDAEIFLVELARDLGTNPNKLQASFKAAFGITIGDYCLERRIREAQQLLLEGKLSVAEVAERVGYGHQSNFAAAFSSHLGMSPREYRRHRAPVHLSLGAAEADLAEAPRRSSGRP